MRKRNHSPKRILLFLGAISIILVEGLHAGVVGSATNAANGHIYLLLESATWSALQDEAVKRGGDLVTINNADEQAWVYSTFANFGGQARNLWIGLEDADQDRSYSWASGEETTYSNYASGEPNHYAGIEFYVAMRSDSGKWNDFPDGTYSVQTLPCGVVEISTTNPSSLLGAGPSILGFDADRQLSWTNSALVDCAYRIETCTSMTSEWTSVLGMDAIHGAEELISVIIPEAAQATESAFFRVVWTNAPPIEDLHPPFRFVVDAVCMSTSDVVQLNVVDSRGTILPKKDVNIGVTAYWHQTPDARLVVDSDHLATLTSTVAAPFFSFRVGASYRGIAVESPAMVFAYPDNVVRPVFESEHWRLFVPNGWITNALARFPDFGEVLDIGREAQSDLMGWTYGESWNSYAQNTLTVPWEAIAEDPTTVAYSGNPIGFSQSAFFAGFDGDPWWAAIFHELGHNSASLVRVIMYGELTYGGGYYVEGDANILSKWSGMGILASPVISAVTKASIQRQYDDNSLTASNALAAWAESGVPFDDSAGNWVWEGIHDWVAYRYGRQYLRRYVRAWRSDDTTRHLIWGTPLPSDWWSVMTTAQRATFMAAAMSAAVEDDLRWQFVDWRFPIDDALFSSLYSHFITTMNTPL
jgi:hypothetical protein